MRFIMLGMPWRIGEPVTSSCDYRLDHLCDPWKSTVGPWTYNLLERTPSGCIRFRCRTKFGSRRHGLPSPIRVSHWVCFSESRHDFRSQVFPYSTRPGLCSCRQVTSRLPVT